MDVSIICPVFNTGANLLAAAVRSVLNQAGPHRCEVVLVDDASTSQATHAALRAAAADERVRVLHQPKNAGPGQARTAGLRQAKHDWIGFIDSDDLWPEGKLDQAQMVLQERPDARWISGNYATLLPSGDIRPSLRLTRKQPAAEPGRHSKRLATPDLTRVLIQDWLPLGSSLIRRDLIQDAGGFHPRLLYGEDWLLNLRMSALAAMDYIEDETYVLRRQGASMMRSPARMSRKLALSGRIARRDPLLRPVRRELRWFDYATHKDIAMNKALNGQRLKAGLVALRALAIDPREVGELALFLRYLMASGRAQADGLRRYSSAEQVILSDLESSTVPRTAMNA